MFESANEFSGHRFDLRLTDWHREQVVTLLAGGRFKLVSSPAWTVCIFV